jgi:hypothetical protein
MFSRCCSQRISSPCKIRAPYHVTRAPKELIGAARTVQRHSLLNVANPPLSCSQGVRPYHARAAWLAGRCSFLLIQMEKDGQCGAAGDLQTPQHGDGAPASLRCTPLLRHLSTLRAYAPCCSACWSLLIPADAKGERWPVRCCWGCSDFTTRRWRPLASLRPYATRFARDMSGWSGWSGSRQEGEPAEFDRDPIKFGVRWGKERLSSVY